MSEFNPYDPPASLHSEPEQTASGAASGNQHTGRMLEYLRGTRPWVLFIAILAYVGSGFAAIGGLAVMAAAGVAKGTGAAEAGIVVGAGLLYLVGAAVGVWWATMLIKYAQSIGRAIESDRTGDVEDAILRQRNFWKANGILAIVYIAFVIVALLALTIAAAAGAIK